MFYIYHIPERNEWGCTNNLKRRLCQLKYKFEQVDRVITTANINIAAELEKQMNLEYGYYWNDSRYYTKVLKMHSDENRSKGGSIGGKIGGPKAGQIAKTTGQIYELSEKASIAVVSTCIKTGKQTIHKSIHAAGEFVNGSASKVCAVCKGKRKTHMKHKFEYLQ